MSETMCLRSRTRRFVLRRLTLPVSELVEAVETQTTKRVVKVGKDVNVDNRRMAPPRLAPPPAQASRPRLRLNPLANRQAVRQQGRAPLLRRAHPACRVRLG